MASLTEIYGFPFRTFNQGARARGGHLVVNFLAERYGVLFLELLRTIIWGDPDIALEMYIRWVIGTAYTAIAPALGVWGATQVLSKENAKKLTSFAWKALLADALAPFSFPVLAVYGLYRGIKFLRTPSGNDDTRRDRSQTRPS